MLAFNSINLNPLIDTNLHFILIINFSVQDSASELDLISFGRKTLNETIAFTQPLPIWCANQAKDRSEEIYPLGHYVFLISSRLITLG